MAVAGQGRHFLVAVRIFPQGTVDRAAEAVVLVVLQPAFPLMVELVVVAVVVIPYQAADLVGLEGVAVEWQQQT